VKRESEKRYGNNSTQKRDGNLIGKWRNRKGNSEGWRGEWEWEIKTKFTRLYYPKYAEMYNS